MEEGSELIFVMNITNYIRGEEIVMWRNFSFPCKTIVGKLTILGNFGKFATIYALSCGEKLGPKTFVEKKRQIWGLHQSNQNKKGDDDFDFNADYRYCRLQLYKEE